MTDHTAAYSVLAEQLAARGIDVDAAYVFGRYPIEAGPETDDELAQRLAATNYWTQPLENLREGKYSGFQFRLRSSGVEPLGGSGLESKS